MRPANFDYHRPGTVEEAVQLLASNDGAKALAGGHSLLPAMNLRLSTPNAIVDIGQIGALRGISAANGLLTIGALTTHAQIAASAEVRQHCPALAQACGQVGDPQVRNWGTLGGNIAHADPASDPPTVVLACGGTIHTHGTGGKRAINAGDFFIDLLMTDLQPGELITQISIPSQAGKKSAYAKMAHPASRYAVVGVCVVLTMNGATCSSASVAVGGAVPKAMRSPGAEAALSGSTLDAGALDHAAQALMNDIGGEVMGDVFAPEAYRRAMAGIYLKKAIRAAVGS